MLNCFHTIVFFCNKMSCRSSFLFFSQLLLPCYMIRSHNQITEAIASSRLMFYIEIGAKTWFVISHIDSFSVVPLNRFMLNAGTVIIKKCFALILHNISFLFLLQLLSLKFEDWWHGWILKRSRWHDASWGSACTINKLIACVFVFYRLQTLLTPGEKVSP